MEYGITEVFVKHDFYSSLKIKFIKEENGKTYLLKDLGDKFSVVKEISNTKKVYLASENFHPSKLDYQLKYIYEDGEYSVYRYKYIMHVGSSRSSKSFSLEEAAIRKCEEIPNLRINIWRDTRESLSGTIWADFKKLFPLSGRKYNFTRNTVPIYFNNSSRIEPHGADSTNAHGTTQDIAWLNEPYKITNEAFTQIAMRSNQVWMDLNPKAKHWSDTVAKNPRCKVIHSTFMLNPFCPTQQKAEILSFNPDNPVNVANGTADAYNWNVYGLGLKAEKPNRIYKGFGVITKEFYDGLPFPEYYGMDFGSTNPSAVVGVKYNGENEFFTHEYLYKPISQMTGTLAENLIASGIRKDLPLVCDSADPSRIAELTVSGFNVIPASKPNGSVNQGIDFINSMKNFYTECSLNYEYEYENYEWEVINGMNLDRPIKKDDHILDADRYIKTYLQFYLGINQRI
tara:strand:+ start:6729 stop:8096 length:1368 start_codon:yes stop_codon:yes gene_type:complete